MNPWVLWIVLATIALVVIMFSVRRYQSKISYQEVNVMPQKLFLQSPEYRCSTKCFDCVREQSHMYLQKSHGRPVMHVGL
jgi:hypothetical protein